MSALDNNINEAVSPVPSVDRETPITKSNIACYALALAILAAAVGTGAYFLSDRSVTIALIAGGSAVGLELLGGGTFIVISRRKNKMPPAPTISNQTNSTNPVVEAINESPNISQPMSIVSSRVPSPLTIDENDDERIEILDEEFEVQPIPEMNKDKETAMGELQAQGISEADAEKLYTFIMAKYRDLCEQAATEERVIIERSNKDLPRTCYFTGDGRVVIGFHKQRKKEREKDSEIQGDKKVGSGRCKMVTSAIEFFSGQLLASSSMNADKAKKELEGYRLTHGIRGIIQLYLYVPDYDHKGRTKVRFFTPICQEEDFRMKLMAAKFIDEYKFSIDSKIKHSQDLLRMVAEAHARNLVIGDLKEENLLLDSKDNICLCDLEEIAELETEGTRITTGTAKIWSPRYVAIVDHVEKPGSESLSTKNKIQDESKPARDIWALGCILYKLLYEEDLVPWLKNAHNEQAHKEAIKGLTKDPEIPPGPFQMLIEAMLKIDPEKRMGAAALSFFDWKTAKAEYEASQKAREDQEEQVMSDEIIEVMSDE